LLKEHNARWSQVDWLAAYSPELNLGEQHRNHTKWGDLATFVPDGTADLRQAAQQSLNNQRRNPIRLDSYCRGANLT
jgi:hypothetical protein